jgi:hypothetical protein
MDNWPTWVVWICAAAVGISPGLAILSAPSIARLLHRLLGARPEVVHNRTKEPRRHEPAGAPG